MFIERRLRDNPDLLTNYTEKAERLQGGVLRLLDDPNYDVVGRSKLIPKKP